VANLAAVAIENARLEEETIKAKDALKARKLIEKAKGMLMKSNNMTEGEAYMTMRKKAMDLCKPLKEIAEAIILTDEIKKK
jgi:response regulator NasT